MFGVEKFGDRNSTLQLFHVREERCSPNVARPKGEIVCSLITENYTIANLIIYLSTDVMFNNVQHWKLELMFNNKPIQFTLNKIKTWSD